METEPTLQYEVEYFQQPGRGFDLQSNGNCIIYGQTTTIIPEHNTHLLLVTLDNGGHTLFRDPEMVMDYVVD